MSYRCTACGTEYAEDALIWRCGECGSTLDIDIVPMDMGKIDRAEPGVWRYAAALPAVDPRQRVRLGEVMTPLVPAPRLSRGLLLKVDYLFPSGSYKDRGSSLMVSKLRSLGVDSIMDDSSGNAGASIAAYAAAAGMDCAIYAPSATSPGKLAQIASYGAELVRVDGDRAAVADAITSEAASGERFYASHIYQPLFIAGCATAGFEIWEQLGYRAPAAIVASVGYGSQLLGLARAFASLRAGGAIDRTPRLFAAQAAAFPALTRAFDAGADALEAAQDGTTVAEGIACRLPARGPAMLAAIRESGGGAVAVSEEAIAAALRELAGCGYFVEPTAAVAHAAYRALVARGTITESERAVVILSGSGLKASALAAGLIAG